MNQDIREAFTKFQRSKNIRLYGWQETLCLSILNMLFSSLAQHPQAASGKTFALRTLSEFLTIRGGELEEKLTREHRK